MDGEKQEDMKHLRAGAHTACGIQLWGAGRRTREKINWVNGMDEANCPECVLNALPYTLLLPEGSFKL
jgi:hypothetical protein